MKIVIDVKYEESFTATSKAREDVNDILKKNGYQVKFIDVKRIESKKNIISNINNGYKQLKEILSKVPGNSTIVFQYPFDWMNYKYSKIIKKYSNRYNIKTVVLIHDLNSIRTSSMFGKLYYEKMVKEFKFLNNFDKIICHNTRMKTYLLNKKINEEKIIVLKLFDYLIDNNKKANNGEYKKVIVAGNLSKNKAGYVYNLKDLKNTNYRFELYGVNYEGASSNNIEYKVKFQSDKPQEFLKSGFGLVWDGPNCNSCEGNYGNYLMWNNPHKLSLYISCGLPVIVWKKSALSDFVEQNKIGVSVNNLDELDEIFKNLTELEYKKYLSNVSKIQKKVVDGKFLLEAIKKI